MVSSIRSGTISFSVFCVAYCGSLLLCKLYKSQQQRKTREKTIKSTSLGDLPTEVITEIISYLSVEDFLRCKSVWKQLNVYTEDRDFVEKFMMRKTVNYFCNFRLEYALETKSSVTRTLATCDGLKFKRKYVKKNSPENTWEHSFYIKNSSTRDILKLPQPPSTHTHADYAFSFVQLTGKYKVVVVYTDSGKRHCAVLTLGTDENKWRDHDIPGSSSSDSEDVVQAGTILHCVRAFKDAYEIISFNMETESFSVSILDKSSSIVKGKEDREQWAINWNGLLSFVYIECDELKVLILEDYKTQKWQDMFTVLLSFVTETKYVEEVIPLFAENGLLWFKTNYHIRLGVDLETGKIAQRVDSRYSFDHFIEGGVFSLVPSLVTLKGMQHQKDPSTYRLAVRRLSKVMPDISYCLYVDFTFFCVVVSLQFCHVLAVRYSQCRNRSSTN